MGNRQEQREDFLSGLQEKQKKSLAGLSPEELKRQTDIRKALEESEKNLPGNDR